VSIVATKQLTYRIGMDIGELRRNAEAAGTATRAFKKELAELEAKQRAHHQSLTALGTGMAVFGASVAFGLAAAAKAAIDWESAFTGVRKTVDGSDAEIDALEGSLRGLARTLPATHAEIAGVAEAAGQLGIKRQDIAAFTETMIALGETTNLTAEEAATDLAKFANIMGTSAGDVDRLGSALVALGNNGASTEKDIISMGLRIAGAGKQIGLTEAQVLGIASALSSVGIEAESGGSAISNTMVKIATAVNEGGTALDQFAEVAGMSSDRFASKFRIDAAGAIVAFIQGLGEMQRTGGNVFGVLDQLGLSEIRVRDALLRSASASELFTDSIKTGSKAWAENKALAEEAAKRYDTTEAKLQIAGNRIKDALIDIGGAIAPMVAAGAEGIGDIVRFFQELPGPIKEVVSWVGLAVGAVTLFGGAALVATPKILAFRASMQTMVATGGAFTGALGKFGLFMAGPWGAAIGLGVTLLGLFAGQAGAASRQEASFAESGKAVAKAIAEQNGVINESVRQSTAKELADKKVYAVGRALGISLNDITDAVLGQGDAYERVSGKLHDLMDNGSKDQQVVAEMLLNSIDAMVGGKREEIQAEKDVAAVTGETTDKQKGQAQSAEALAEATKEAAEALDSLIDQLDTLNGRTLSAREAQRGYLDSIAAVNQAITDNGTSLDINTVAGRANLEALDGQAKAALDLADATAREAEANGGAAAGAAALTASLQASRQELFNTARQFGLSEAEAWAYVDSVLAIPPEASTEVLTPGIQERQNELAAVRQKVNEIPPGKEINVGVLSQAAIQKLQELGFKVVTLPNGTVTVTALTAGAQGALNNFIASNSGRSIPIKINVQGGGQVARPGGRMWEADGGIIRAYAGGGIEAHNAQIARTKPGTVRMWAEPETQGETYLPWAMSKRADSLKYMRLTARAWGFDVVPMSGRSFAGGGINGGAGGGWPAFTIGFAPGTSRLQRELLAALRPVIQADYGGNVQRALGTS
jgi:TP901 family phage tail tape measure protein